jgi:hypothetical protein
VLQLNAEGVLGLLQEQVRRRRPGGPAAAEGPPPPAGNATATAAADAAAGGGGGEDDDLARWAAAMADGGPMPGRAGLDELDGSDAAGRPGVELEMRLDNVIPEVWRRRRAARWY